MNVICFVFVNESQATRSLPCSVDENDCDVYRRLLPFLIFFPPRFFPLPPLRPPLVAAAVAAAAAAAVASAARATRASSCSPRTTRLGGATMCGHILSRKNSDCASSATAIVARRGPVKNAVYSRMPSIRAPHRTQQTRSRTRCRSIGGEGSMSTERRMMRFAPRTGRCALCTRTPAWIHPPP